MTREAGPTPATATGRVEITGQPITADMAVSPEAERVAQMLEAPLDPDNPRYDNHALVAVSDLVIRVAHGETGAMPFKELTDGVQAASQYTDAVTDERDAKRRKGNAADYLIGMFRRHPWFRGFGFPEDNTTATIVETTKKREIKEEHVPEVVMQAGQEIRDIGNHYLTMSVNMQGLKDRRGRAMSAEALQGKVEAFLERTLHPDNHGVAKFAQSLVINNWKKLAGLVRRGKISPELITIERGPIVKPIPLHATPDRKTSGADVQSGETAPQSLS